MHFYQGTVLKCPPGSFVSIGGFMVRIILNWHAIFRSIRWLILTLFNFTVWVRELIFIETNVIRRMSNKRKPIVL